MSVDPMCPQPKIRSRYASRAVPRHAHGTPWRFYVELALDAASVAIERRRAARQKQGKLRKYDMPAGPGHDRIGQDRLK